MLILYIALVLTTGVMTYQKGRIGLFLLGFIFPVLWIIGAMMSPKVGSKRYIDAQERLNADVQKYTR